MMIDNLDGLNAYHGVYYKPDKSTLFIGWFYQSQKPQASEADISLTCALLRVKRIKFQINERYN